MILLSKTEDGGRVVELTRLEFKEFSLLVNALEGKTEADSWNFGMEWSSRNDQSMSPQEKYQFEGVFGAILAFAKARFRANELRELLNDMDNYLNVQGKEHV
jgi:hypothetical protein